MIGGGGGQWVTLTVHIHCALYYIHRESTNVLWVLLPVLVCIPFHFHCKLMSTSGVLAVTMLASAIGQTESGLLLTCCQCVLANLDHPVTWPVLCWPQFGPVTHRSLGVHHLAWGDGEGIQWCLLKKYRIVCPLNCGCWITCSWVLTWLWPQVRLTTSQTAEV